MICRIDSGAATDQSDPRNKAADRSRSFGLAALPIYVARIPAAPFAVANNCEVPPRVSVKEFRLDPKRSFLCVRGRSLLGLRDNAKIRLRSLPPLGIEPFGFFV